MKSEKLHKVKTIFEKALELDHSKRNDFINAQCKDDEELKQEVLSLLNVYDKTSEFLEVPPKISEPFENISTFKDSFIGKRIGNYVIESEAGVGGMGIVYKGRRADKEFEQEVAIKILKHHLNSEYVLKRFQIERQTLAKLQHPNIARLLDGGTTDDGLPYLIMEYIDGTSLIEYCDEKHLNIKQRLELFRTVCGAVQFAHQNLIVHRDIKPGNVLVNKEGRPKLLDFGIAKLLDDEIALDETQLTKPGMWHLTPEYASPEQINAETVTTKSDIYSLGILLYQLLTGHQPYKITSASPVALSKLITEGSVLKPSEKFQLTEEISLSGGATKQITPQSVSNSRNEKPERIYHHLKGDIDNIILKAIHKDPERRYASVEQFSEDIRRHLIGLPVIARSDTVGYRLTKFIQRHKVGFVSSIVFILFLIVSAVMIVWQANIAADERDKAKTELLKFEKINNFILEMLSSADPGASGRDVKVYDLLEKAAKDVDVTLKGQPKIKSAIKETLGSTFIGLGEYKKAEGLLKESFELNKELFGLDSRAVAKSYHQLGLCYDYIGNYQLADSFYLAGINTYRKVESEPLNDLADNLNDYGTMMTNLGQYDSAAVLLKRALNIYNLNNKEKGKKEAITIINLAVNLHQQYKIDQAEKFYLQAQKILNKLYGMNIPEMGYVYNNLAFIYLDKNNFEKSEEAFKKAYKVKTALLGENHPSVGLALINMGMLYITMKEYDKAEDPLLKAVEMFNKINAKKDPILSLGYYWLGRSYLESNQLAKAETAFINSIEIKEEVYGKNHSKTWSSKGELGICYLKQKKYAEAGKLLGAALDFYKNDKYKNIRKIRRYTEYSAILYKELGNKTKSDFYQTELKKLKNQSPTVR